MKSQSRLVLDNADEQFVNAVWELTIANGESVRLNFHLPREHASQTVREIERAMWKRIHQMSGELLAQTAA